MDLRGRRLQGCLGFVCPAPGLYEEARFKVELLHKITLLIWFEQHYKNN